jgi:hypothetical protein
MRLGLDWLFGWIRIVFTLRYQALLANLHSLPCCPVFVLVFPKTGSKPKPRNPPVGMFGFRSR